MIPAVCLATHCFCEGPYTGEPVLQPANTWSALAFLVVAAGVYIHGKRHWVGFFTWLYIAALTLLWFGTAFFHATLTNIGQWSDGLGLYAVITFVAVYFIGSNFSKNRSFFIAVYLAINIAAGIFSLYFMQFRLPLFGALVGATFLIIIYCGQNKMSYRRADLLMSLLFFGTGLIFQVLDNKLVLCSHFSPWQGHALWHLLSAVATWYLYQLMANAAQKANP